MSTLAEALARPSSRAARLAADAALVVGGSLVVAALAQISIKLPFTPVPITGQTLAVLVVGTAFGWMRAFATVGLYLAEIAVGLPFAAEGNAGLEVLTLSTPSAGYLWGFLVAGTVMGKLANRGWDRRLPTSILVMLIGSLVIYGFGVPWLAASLDVSLSEALSLGMYPFLLGDALKLLIAAGLLPTAWALVRRDRSDRRPGPPGRAPAPPGRA